MVAAASVSGCQTTVVSETNYAAYREALVGSPALYRANVSKCAATLRQHPNLAELALVANVSAEKYPETACERLTKAQRDGRLTYEHHVLATKGMSSPEIVRIIQGR